MVTQEEIQTLADEISKVPGSIAVTIDTALEPTYETEAGKLKRAPGPDNVHQFVPRRDAAGEHIRHPVRHLNIQLGRVTKGIQLEWGGASAHENVPRTREEVLALVERSVSELLVEAHRKPPTAAEHAAWTQEQTRIAAARAASDRAKHAAELRAAMTPEEIAAADYLALHGEPDFHAQPGVEHHDAHVAAAVARGTMSPAEAEQIAAWKRRSEQRREAEHVHASDPAALAAAHAKINEGV